MWWLGHKSAFAKILTDLNLAVRYNIAIRIIFIICEQMNFNLMVVKADCQTTKFSGNTVCTRTPQ